MFERLRRLFHRTREADMQRELQSHIEEEIEEQVGAGLPVEEASHAARRAFGSMARVMEDARETWRWATADMLVQDLKYALRQMRRNPGFTAVAALSLTVGIGGNCAMFSMADAFLLRPLPVPRPNELLNVGPVTRLDQSDLEKMSYPDFRDLQKRQSSFKNMAAFMLTRVRISERRDAGTELKMGVVATDDFFATMQVEPELGRVFSSEENQVPGRDAVAVVSHKFREAQWGADSPILERSLVVNGIDFRVIGVLPEEFTGPDQWVQPEIYFPMMMWPRLSGDERALVQRDLRNLDVKGRLGPGLTIAAAQAEAVTISGALQGEYPATNRDNTFQVRTELQQRTAESRPVAMMAVMVMILAGAVLIVACANIAGLLTSRAPSRAKEISVRLAIGAGRVRLIRQLLTESALLALLGTVGGLVLGYAGVQFLKQINLPVDIPVVVSFQLDSRAIMFSLVTAALSVFLFGLVPALRTARTDLNAALRGTAESARQRFHGRSALVCGQVALAMVLLTIATFMYMSFRRELLAGLGFSPDGVLTMVFDPSLTHSKAEQVRAFYSELIDRVRETPGVRAASLASVIPMNYELERLNVSPEGHQFPVGQENVIVLGSRIDESYFETLGVPLTSGRGIRAGDGLEAPPVAVVNESFATRYWPGQSAVGKRLRLSSAADRWVEIVGVTTTGKVAWLAERPQEFVYLPSAQYPSALERRSRMVLLVKTAGDPAALAAPLREVVRGIDANQPVFDVRTMKSRFEMAAVNPNLIIIQLIGAMGALGVFLSLTGLYGLVAYQVSTRTREFGLRMALGAQRKDVLALVLRPGVFLAAVGTAGGALLSVTADRLMAAAFPGNKHSILAYLIVVPGIFLVTLLAAYIPARRAAVADPASTLRNP